MKRYEAFSQFLKLILQLHEITLKTYGNGKNIRIYDCRGIDPIDNETAFEDDLCKIIEGHIMKGYEVKKEIIALTVQNFLLSLSTL